MNKRKYVKLGNLDTFIPHSCIDSKFTYFSPNSVLCYDILYCFSMYYICVCINEYFLFVAKANGTFFFFFLASSKSKEVGN